jgi:hypothetical protein
MILRAPNRLRAKWFLILPGIAIFLGLLVYLLARPVPPVVIVKLQNAVPFSTFESPGRLKELLNAILPGWVIYSFPNALWAFGYAMVITGIWSGSKSPLAIFWYATIPALILGFELLQLTEMIPGTFSTCDLMAGMLGMIAGILGGIITTHRNHTNKINHEITTF